MKYSFYILIALASVFLSACSDSNSPETSDNPSADLNYAISKTELKISSMVANMKKDVTHAAANELDSAAIRTILKSFLNNNQEAEEYGYLNSKAVLQYIEPSKYYSYEGTDFSNETGTQKIISTKQMGVAKLFLAVEGYYAVAIGYPFVKNNDYAGAFDLLFKPKEILDDIIDPLEKEKGINLWVMEKGGATLYDSDTIEIGRNVFTDSLYNDMPSVFAACKLIDSLETGSSEYEYNDWNTNELIKKVCHWKTYSFYGILWRFIWTKKIN